MRSPIALIDDLSRRPDDQTKAIDTEGSRRSVWIRLSCIVFGIAFGAGVAFGIRALIAAP
jgi:hypothetical protein